MVLNRAVGLGLPSTAVDIRAALPVGRREEFDAALAGLDATSAPDELRTHGWRGGL
ncbi:hypothetical protein [Streptomyces niveus]|uniref:hypothetical protein n=1 Tax=Streptomyces niveus TaxID=193462 RepID=UPI00364BBC6D